MGFVAKQRIVPISYRRILARGHARDEERFLVQIAERLGSDTKAIPIGRARAGIYLLARYAVRGRRRKVLMSPYTIPDVVTMVVLAGAEPVFYDFEPGTTSCSLESLRSLLDEETACAIITHYHVNESRLGEVAALCRAIGAYLFDDCALAFGGNIQGRPIGTLTDASVFSFSSFKLLNFFWGGLITTADAGISGWIVETIKHWPRLVARDYAAAFKSCLKYDLGSSPPIFDWLVFPLIQRRVSRSQSAESLQHVRIETNDLNQTLISRPALAAFSEWASKLAKIEFWLAHRRKIACVYRRSLGDRMVGAKTSSPVVDGSCFANFPVIVPNGRGREIARAMMLAGYDVGRSLYPNAHRHPKFTMVKGNSFNVDQLVASTIYLPTHFGVSEQYAEDIGARLAKEIGF